MNYSDDVILSLLIAVVDSTDILGGNHLPGSEHLMLKNIVQAERRSQLVMQAAEGISNSTKQHLLLRNII